MSNPRRHSHFWTQGKSWAMHRLLDPVSPVSVEAIRAAVADYEGENGNWESRQFAMGAKAACADYERAMALDVAKEDDDD